MNPSLAGAPIAERLRAARVAAKKTQQELAGDDFSKSYISAIERGKMTPSIQALGLLSERLGVPIAYFLGESDVELSTLAQGLLQGSNLQLQKQIREETVLLTLLEAEGWLRQHHPDKAILPLQNSDGPPPDLPELERPRWYWLIGWTLLQLDRLQEATHIFNDGLVQIQLLLLKTPIADQPVLQELAVRINWALGICYSLSGQPNRALDYHLLGLAAIKEHVVTDPEVQMLIYEALGRDYLALRQPDEAKQVYEEASQILQPSEELQPPARHSWELALACKGRDQVRLGQRHMQKALALFSLLENPIQSAEVQILLGRALLEARQYQKAEYTFRQALASAEQSGDIQTCAAALSGLSRLHLATGNPSQAMRMAQEGVHLAEQRGNQAMKAQLFLLLAAAYEAQKQIEQAEQAFQEALSVLKQTTDVALLAQAHECYGIFLERQQRFQEAFVQMQTATRLATHRDEGTLISHTPEVSR